MSINDNIQTSVKYMSCLLLKRLYAAGLAWLNQGLGMKGTSMKQGKTGMGEKTVCERWEDHSDMETDISETGNIGTKGETRGTGTNRGVSEMWQKIERTSGRKGVAEDNGVGQTCWRSIGDWYLTMTDCVPPLSQRRYFIQSLWNFISPYS